MTILLEPAPVTTEASGPHLDRLPPTAHLLLPVIERARTDPQAIVAAYRDGDRFVDVNAADFYLRIRQLAKGLMACGVAPGDRVALMSHTRLEWLHLDYAILAAGGVTVPAYETSSAEQLQWILDDSGAVLVVVENHDMAGMLAGRDRLPSFVIDEGGLDDLAERGRQIDDGALDERIAGIRSGDLATIIYTSGTTGRPKGCPLTHGHLRTNALQNLDAIRGMLQPDETTFLFLPLAHSLTKIIALVGMEWGFRIACATDMTHLQEELPMVRPTMVVAVPRVFEKVFNAAEHKAHAEGHGGIFEKAVDVAIRWSEDHSVHRHRPVTDVEHLAFDRLVYRKVKEVFGGRMRFAFSGGGPLGERLTHFFNGVGVRIFEGYGLTETSPTLTVNRSDGWKPGTVGQPLAGTSIRIAEDGEVLAQGPQVFFGYWHNGEATMDVFDEDGWFKTGDIGALDESGYLRITGRKKELIVTAAGKNVAPAPLEDRLRAHPLISQAVVVGDARPFVAAMLTLDEEALREWALDRHLDGMTLVDLTGKAEVLAALQEAVDDANLSVSRAESIREFRVLPSDLTIAAGELTPTLKVRRNVVERKYADVIESIYR